MINTLNIYLEYIPLNIYLVLMDSSKQGLYWNVYIQAQGPYWENINPKSLQYGPSATRSVQKRPRADILPVRSRANLVDKRFIIRLKFKGTQVRYHSGPFGTVPGPLTVRILTSNKAFWLVDFSYWLSDCASRVIKQSYCIDLDS